MRPPKYDWHKIEQEFIHDNVPLHNGVTLKTIAEKYGIPYQTVRRKAAADGWHSSRYFCYRMKNGDDATFYEKIDQQIKEIEKRTIGRCGKTGRFMKGNQFALGNKGNRQPKYGNRNAVKHGLFAKGFTIRIEKGHLIVCVGNGLGVESYRVPPNLFYEDERGRIRIHENVAMILEEKGVQLESVQR